MIGRRAPIGSWLAGVGLALSLGATAPGCNVALGVDDFSADGCPAVGSRRCAGDTLQTCGADGEWRDLRDCVEGCRDGACALECLPGQLRCADSLPQACTRTGQWAASGAACAPSTPCLGGLCGAICVPGDLRCDGDTAQECDEAGHWGGDKECSKDCIHGLCTECTPGEVACENKTPRTCTGEGQWEIHEACKKDEQCSQNGTCEKK